MNNIILFFAILLSAQLSFAQNYSKKDLVKLSTERLFPDGAIRKRNVDMSDIIQKWNALFDAQNLRRDLNKKRIDWKKVFPITQDKIHRITGRRVFYGAIPKKYNYTIFEDYRTNQLIVNVKMHFYPSKKYLKRMKAGKEIYQTVTELNKAVAENVSEAEILWNLYAPKNVTFKFDVMEKASQADYSIKLVTFYGGLYDKFITAPAYADILSHEVGHMMGLDDEYTLVTSNVVPVNELIEKTQKRYADRDMDYTALKDMRCNLESVMCLRDTIYDYHIDHILGRMTLSN